MIIPKFQKNIIRFKSLYKIITIMMAIVTIAVLISTLYFGKNNREVDFFKQLITIVGMIFAMILFIGTCFNSKETSYLENIFAITSLLFFILIGLSGLIDILTGNSKYALLLYTTQTLIYIVSNIAHLFIWHYQCFSFEKDNLYRYLSYILYAIVIVYMVLLIINPFTKILFYVDELGYLIYPSYALDLALTICFYLSFLIFIVQQKYPIKNKLGIFSFSFFPLLYLVFAFVWNSYNIKTTNNSIGYIFLLFALYVAFFLDYKDSKEKILQQKIDIAEKEREKSEFRTVMMLSQMSPHFLYNSLTAIRNLCRKDPMEAYNSLGNFADYLRLNMDALENGNMISFGKELEHIKTYLYLEQMRFGDDLKVEYDIQFTDFYIPALTVQPIVENAVRHGATMNEKGGKVLISSSKTVDGALIIIEDNGPGFDPDKINNNDNNNHYGLLNVRRCLDIRECGHLTINSKPGNGTKVYIYIKEIK